MFKTLVWYVRYFRYCWLIGKQRDVLDFFEPLRDDDGKRYNLNIRQMGKQLRKRKVAGELSKGFLVQNEMYNVLNDQQDEAFAEEISVLIMMLMIWGMQRTYGPNEE